MFLSSIWDDELPSAPTMFLQAAMAGFKSSPVSSHLIMINLRFLTADSARRLDSGL